MVIIPQEEGTNCWYPNTIDFDSLLARVLLPHHHTIILTLPSQVTDANFKSIKLRPDSFQRDLQHNLGFKLLQILQPTADSKGFERPIFIFEKPRS